MGQDKTRKKMRTILLWLICHRKQTNLDKGRAVPYQIDSMEVKNGG